MSVEVSGRFALRDIFGQVGEVTIPLQRFRNIAACRLLLLVPFAVLPTQFRLRGSLSEAWAPEFGRWAVDTHLLALLFYVLANVWIIWLTQEKAEDRRRVIKNFNRLAIGCEIVTNQAFFLGYGSLDNYSVGFLVIIIVLYRVLFEYRTALVTAFLATGIFLFFALLEVMGEIPSGPLFPYAFDHPIRADVLAWATVLVSVPLIAVVGFGVTNYAVNQSARLHWYMTRSVLQRYLPPALVERAAEGELRLDAPAERRTVTVLFTDIVGFTALSERLGAEAVGELLDRLLGEVATLAHEHGATVDKFIGDCVMIVFGAPEECSPEDQVTRCIALAQAIHAKVKESGAQYALQARSGMNTGEAVVGNFGSQARSDYTVLGPSVNVAARLEAASRPDSILVGIDSIRFLQDDMTLEAAGALQLKGISKPVEAWFVPSMLGEA